MEVVSLPLPSTIFMLTLAKGQMLLPVLAGSNMILPKIVTEELSVMETVA
jgi:hypothetical protein